MTRAEFEAALREAMDGLPERFRQQLDNLEFLVEDEPSPEQARRLGAVHLLGLYEGVPLPKRQPGMGYHGVLPDRITLFQGPIESVSRGRAEVIEHIRKVLLHEIGHYFGIDDAQLRKLGY
jgi:predicted Zn-dependent protease with MMP-like domain